MAFDYVYHSHCYCYFYVPFIIRMFQCNWFEIVAHQMGVSPPRIYVIGSISAQPLNLPNPSILQSNKIYILKLSTKQFFHHS